MGVNQLPLANKLRTCGIYIIVLGCEIIFSFVPMC